MPLWGLAARAERDLQSLPSQHPQADALLEAQCLALYTPRSPPQTDDPHIGHHQVIHNATLGIGENA